MRKDGDLSRSLNSVMSYAMPPIRLPGTVPLRPRCSAGLPNRSGYSSKKCWSATIWHLIVFFHGISCVSKMRKHVPCFSLCQWGDGGSIMHSILPSTRYLARGYTESGRRVRAASLPCGKRKQAAIRSGPGSSWKSNQGRSPLLAPEEWEILFTGLNRRETVGRNSGLSSYQPRSLLQ